MGFRLLVSFFSLILSQVSSDQVIGTYNLMLDPGRLYWWQTKWVANPIDLSKTNLSATGVTATFYFNPSTSITNGVFEVTFPTGFSVVASSGVTVVGAVVQIAVSTITAGVDNTVSVSGVTLPSVAGPYGPFALVTRLNGGGQIIDANLNFGMVYITPAAGTLGNASVTFVPTQSSTIVNTANNWLSFKFNIGQNLWTHDLFKITIDQRFKMVQGSAECSSAGVTGYYNNFNGTVPGSPHTLDCVVSTSSPQVLWIYGLAVNFIDVSIKDNTYLDLRVPGFTNPNSAYSSSAQSWTIETVRFMTGTTLESVVVTGPTVTPATLTTATWKPTWGMSLSNSVVGLVMYMDLSVTTVNPIGVGGAIVIIPTETVTSCYLLTDLGATAKCAVSGGILTINGFTTALAAASTIMVRHLVTIVSSAGATASLKITTQNSGGLSIDTGNPLAPFTVAAASAATLITFVTSFADVTGGTPKNYAGGSGDSTLYIDFQITGSAPNMAASSNVEIYCPFSAALDDFQISIPAGFTTVFSSASASFAGATIVGSSATTTGTTPALTTGSILVQPTGIATYTPGKLAFSVGSLMLSLPNLYLGVSHATGIITLPQVANSPFNYMAPYECRVQITNSAGNKPMMIGVSQFTIAGQPFGTLSYTYFCDDAAVAGAPIQVTFVPQVVNLYASTATKTYFFEIGFDSSYSLYHSSGVLEGGAYPVDSNLSTGITMIVSNVSPAGSAIFSHLVSGLGLVSTSSNPVNLYFPVGTTTSNSPTLYFQTCYRLVSDSRQVKYITHSKTLSTYTLAVNAPSTPVASGFGASAPTLGGNNPINASSMGTTPVTLTLTLTAAITGDTYFYVIFPTGFAFSNLRDVQSSVPATGSSFATKKYFSSPNKLFAFPGILVSTSATGTQISTVSTTVSIIGVNVPLGANPTGSSVSLVHGAVNGLLTAGCSAYVSISAFTTVTGTITSWQVSPSTIQSRGPGGVDLSHTIIVTLPHGIDNGGSIALTLNASWGIITSVTTCTIAGINNASYSFATNVLTITGFDDFSNITNNSVTVYLQHLLPPISTSNQSSTIQLVTNIVTYSKAGLKIDVSANNNNGIVTVLAPITVGVSTIQAIRVQPPNAGTADNDLYLRFSLQYDLPAYSQIIVTVPYPLQTATNLKQNCWLSPLAYSSCSFSSGLALTISQSYQALSVLELFVRHAVNAPSTVPAASSTTVYGFKISASWNGASIIADPVTFTPAQLITPAPVVSATITAATTPLDFTPRNAGDVATYTFGFTLGVNLNSTDSVYLEWPDQFDPYLGSATIKFTQEPGNFYVVCASTQLGTGIFCKMDHWIMVITGFTISVAPTAVVLTVSGVTNPPAGPTGNFKVFHYDLNMNLLEYTINLGKVTTVSPATLIQIRSVTASQNTLFSTADYSFGLYISDTVQTTTLLQVQFPQEYDLQLVDMKDSYPCSTGFVDTSAAASVAGTQSWNSGVSCSVSKNLISLSPPTVAKPFTSTSYVTLNVTGVQTPQYGQTRLSPSLTWDFDVQDGVAFPQLSWWVSKFSIFLYQSAATSEQYTSKSYGILNSAYLGFVQPLRTLVVNKYNPQNKSGRIVVWPGTQTLDIQITTANSTVPVVSKSLVFNPTVNTKTPDNGGLLFTSVLKNFVLLYSEYTLNFRVAADIKLAKGLYYVNWQLTEVPQNGTSANLYSSPPMTLVEVPALVVGLYTFVVANIPSVAIGGSSIPISVSVSNPPHSDVTVTIAFQDPSFATASPASLLFSPDISQRFFSISVNSTLDITTVPSFSVLFNLTGTDAVAYQIQPAAMVTVFANPTMSPGNIVMMGIGNVARTTVTIAPVTDRLGVVYYCVSPKGSSIPSFSSLKTLATTFSNLAVSNSTNNRSQTETGPASGETWQQYQTRKYLAHLSSFSVVGAIPMITTTTTQSVQVTGLWAQTVYQVIGYLDVLLSGVQGGLTIEYFTTSNLPQCAQVALSFNLDTPTALVPSVGVLVAKYIGVDPSRVSGGFRTTQASSRRLDTNTTSTTTTVTTVITSTTFTYNLLSDRSIETPDPATQAALSTEAVTDLTADLLTKGITNTFLGYNVLPSLTQTVPQWVIPVAIQSYTNVSLVVEFKASVAGMSCCVALLDTSTSLLTEQVMLGYSYNWTATIHQCVTTNLTLAINNATLSALVPDTSYYVQCVATDNYPIWPTQMDYTQTVPIPFIPIHTPLNLEPDLPYSGAWSLHMLLALVLLIVT